MKRPLGDSRFLSTGTFPRCRAKPGFLPAGGPDEEDDVVGLERFGVEA